MNANTPDAQVVKRVHFVEFFSPGTLVAESDLRALPAGWDIEAAKQMARDIKQRHGATPEGTALGEHMARFCDEAEPKARLRMPELPPRCNSCAFRRGDHTANGSPTTQMDALKCWMEGREFLCHEPARDGALCSGWAMMMLAKDAPDFVKVDWSFSDGEP